MPRTGLFVVVGVLLVCDQAAAQNTVKWRHDYAGARKEATASGRPLLLDFGTEACFWCKKLDATTFRVSGVAEQLNTRFIPVKIDAEQNDWLVKAAAVDSYPTLVLIAPDGKVIARHVGYADTNQMTAFLAKAASTAPSPAPARSGAVDALAQAQADHDAGRYLACLERCDRLMTAFPNTPEADEGRRLAGRITSDPQKWQRVADQIDADLAALKRTLDAAKPR